MYKLQLAAVFQIVFATEYAGKLLKAVPFNSLYIHFITLEELLTPFVYIMPPYLLPSLQTTPRRQN